MKRLNKMMALVVCLLMIMGVCSGVQADNIYASGQLTAAEIPLGDTVTLTVSTNEVTARAFVVIVQFDSGLEFVEAKWLMDGHSVYDASKHKGTLNLGSEKTVSGAVFQLTLKATDTATAPKNITVTLRANNTSGTALYEETVAKAVTVFCDHSYSKWEKKDDDTHSRNCGKCNNIEEQKHNWDNGKVTQFTACDQASETTYTCKDCGATKVQINPPGEHVWEVAEVTKEPTCVDSGSSLYRCATCGTTKTESMPATGEHEYSRWEKADGSNHTRKCGECGKTETESHHWDDGRVNKAPTCGADGTRIHTCTDCGATKTETVPQTGNHSHRDTWSNDSNTHWHGCSVCGHRKDEGAHTPGDPATEFKPQVCTTCGYVIKSALGHTHRYDSTYTTDSRGHWYACSGCEEKKGYAEHFYFNNCQTTCAICGYVREIEHDYSNRLSYDENGHWNACTVCGDVLEVQPHNPGPEATETTDQICLDCGYIIQAAHSHLHTPNGDLLANESSHWYQCACGELIGLDLHAWSDGVKDTQVGTLTYTCTVCGYTKVELLPEGPKPADPVEPTGPDATQPDQPVTPDQPGQNGQPGGSDSDKDTGLAWWWYIIIAVCVLLLGAVIFIIIGILVSRKQVGKFSAK